MLFKMNTIKAGSGWGQGRGLLLHFMSILKRIVATAVWFVTVLKRWKANFFFASPSFFSWAFPFHFWCFCAYIFIVKWMFCFYQTLILFELSQVKLLHSVCFDQYKPLIVQLTFLEELKGKKKSELYIFGCILKGSLLTCHRNVNWLVSFILLSCEGFDLNEAFLCYY